MTRASTGLESAETNLSNPGPYASGDVCGDTKDAGEVEAERDASGVSGGKEGYPGPCASGGVCGDTEDAGEVEAVCDTTPPYSRAVYCCTS
jgi:hypothetical protein